MAATFEWADLAWALWFLVSGFWFAFLRVKRFSSPLAR
jgi:hypothetical protein